MFNKSNFVRLLQFRMVYYIILKLYFYVPAIAKVMVAGGAAAGRQVGYVCVMCGI